jgi:hypothetical protein
MPEETRRTGEFALHSFFGHGRIGKIGHRIA